MENIRLMVFAFFIAYFSENFCHTKHTGYRRLHGNVQSVEKYPKFLVQLVVVPPKELRHDYSTSSCLGSIIHWEWVLTAAHCIYSIDPEDEKLLSYSVSPGYLQMKIGSKFINFGKDVIAKEFHIHREYEESDFVSNDIALIETLPMLFTSDDSPTPIGAVELNTKRIDAENRDLVATVYGWGDKVFRDDTNLTETGLDYLNLHIFQWSLCKIHSGNELTTRQICMAPLPRQTGPCHGDSGGPLMMYGKQIGIVSRSATSTLACGVSPEIYSDVASFDKWITTTVGLDLSSWRRITKNGTDYTTCGIKCKHLLTAAEIEYTRD